MKEVWLSLSLTGMWGWLVCGLVLMMAELFVPGVFIVWIGIGAVLTGFVVAFFPDLSFSFQLVVFAVFSAISVFLGWFVYGKVFGKSEKENYSYLNQGAKEFIGKSYPLVKGIKDGQGQVKIGDTVWLVKSDEALKSGEMVTVDKVDGIVLYVSKKGEKHVS